MTDNPRRRAVLAGAAALACAGPSWAAPPAWKLDAPNVVAITPRLTTSGQPTAAALAGLGAAGFEAVIYLVPGGVSDAVADEEGIVRRQGLGWAYIPVPFDSPKEAHFDAFVAALARWPDKRLLVHCQLNLRASSLVLLHRVLVGREDPERAYDAVAAVWSPSGPWLQLINSLLRKNGMRFVPY